MAVIDKKLIRFRKLTDFQTRLTAGDIKLTSIVFIEDAKRIWAQGNYYYCPEKIQWSDIVGVPTDLGSLGITDVYTKDESDALYLNINGTAVAALKLAEPVNITINGAVTGTVEFDGTKDVAITTAVNHTHDQYENQNAFSTIKAGSGTVSADVVSDTVLFVEGDNISMSVSGDKITINATDTTYNLASTTKEGLMSADDKSKLNEIEEGAQVNTVLGVKGSEETSYRTGQINITKDNIGLGNVENLSKANILANAALTGTPTAPTAAANTNTTQVATTAFVLSEISTKIAAAEAMRFRGTVGTGGTVTSLPASHKVGDTYKVVSAGTYAGVICEIGDMVICTTTGSASNNAHWAVVQANIDGAVIGPTSSVNNRVAVFNGATGKMIKDSGFTIEKSVPADAVFTDTTYEAASTTNNGLMSFADKTKLDGIEENANAYEHPKYTAKSSSLYKVTVDGLGHVSEAEEVTKLDITALGIPSQDTTYQEASTSESGLMSVADKTKLDKAVISNSTITNVVALTQSDYDALEIKDATTLYIVTD